ncbi:MAG: tetratricopeptide repeat protein [Betaproteobacteria bacterium]|nr:tetratricopeptide repeat protein [Betaproteobacteria bacterium]
MEKRPFPIRISALALLFAAGFALYWGTLRHPLVFDDAQLGESFLRAYGASWFHLDLRWFAYASLGWTYDLFDLDWVWFRAGNIALHAGTAGLLFLLMSRLFGAVLPAGAPHGPGANAYAFAGALLFLLHPAAVYGTAYLMQRSILMATLFSLLALLLFLEGLLRGGHRWHLAAAAAFFVAAFSKEHCVMLPAVAAAMAVLVRGAASHTLRATARELLLPAVLFAAIALLVTFKRQGLLGAPYEPFAQAAIERLAEAQSASSAASAASAESAATGAAGNADGAGIYARSIVNQAYLFFRYLMLWVLPWPGWMSIDLRPAFPSGVLSWPQSAGLLLWLAWPVIALRLLVQGGRRGLAGFGMLFPWLLALTEFSVVRIQEPFVLYRSYLWMGGLAALLPAAFGALSRKAGAILLALACALLAPASLNRQASFADEARLWDDAVRKLDDPLSREAERTWRGRGVALFRAGRYDAALRDFGRALEIDPRSADAWMSRGSLYMRTAQSDLALADFDRALRYAPQQGGHYAELRGRRCVVLLRLQKLDEALDDCGQAVRHDPYSAQHQTSLGMTHALRREARQAEAAYARALELAPAYADAHYQYAVLLAGTGRAAEARPHFARACAAGLQAACKRQ